MSVRVLIVDDDRPKVSRLVTLLQETGLERQQIEIAQTGVDARRALSLESFDLLVLDVALPMRAEDAPDRRGGIKLLEELLERGTYKLPLTVVGLTAFEDLHREFVDKFQSRLWALEYYATTDTGWADRLKAKVVYVIARSAQKGSTPYQIDVCAITGLHTPELTAIKKLDWGWSSAISLDEVGYYYRGQFTSGGKTRTAVAAAAPRMGMVASAVLSVKMIAKFRPRLLIMVGICAGVQSNCSVGDVLIADPAWDWQMGKYKDGIFYIAPDQIDISTRVGERFVQLADDKSLWFKIRESFAGIKPENLPTARVGPVTSGSAVLADKRLLSEIKEQHRKLLGIDMEIYGMYAAARDCSPPSPTAFGMKSVCDFADNRKGDQYQPYAAYVSANAFAAFCERYSADFCRDTGE